MEKPAPRRTRTIAASLGAGWLVGVGAVLGAVPAMQLYRDFNVADWLSGDTTTAANVVTSNVPARAKQPAPYIPSASTLAAEAAESRMRDVRRIQHELKRIGCYGGTIDGVWSDRTRQAARIVAAGFSTHLSLDTPDAALLLLLEGQTTPLCKAPNVASDEPKADETALLSQPIAAKPTTPRRSNEPEREQSSRRNRVEPDGGEFFHLRRNSP